jgi:hypothetical protein
MAKKKQLPKKEWVDDSDPGAALREVMDGTPIHPTPTCKACGDTGVNGKGGPCVPCVAAGRVTDESKMDD